MNIITTEQTEYQHVLQTPAHSISFPLNDDDKELIAAMKSKLNDLGGVGLAAPQVNHHRQIIAVYIPEEVALLRKEATPYAMHVLINPVYKPTPDAHIIYDFEACYSVVDKAGKVPRFDAIQISYFDEFGAYHETVEQGFYARVLQHETDHINGVLITDRLTPECVQGSIEEMMALRREELAGEQRLMFDAQLEKKINSSRT